jgi:tetratricopeptide (TPR) repeat protein
MKENKSLPPRTPFRQKIILVLFGLSLFFVLLEVSLRFGGFIVLSLQDYRNKLSIRHKGTYRIMCLGESTTARQYPPILEEILNQSNVGVKFSVVDKGIPAIDTTTILFQLEDNLNQYKPDMVTVMMGVNDETSANRKNVFHDQVFDTYKNNFLMSFRTYKLAKLLWLHIVKKAQEVSELRRVQHRRKLMVSGNSKASGVRERTILPRQENESQDDSVYINAGSRYITQGNYAKAEEAFTRAIALNPHNIYAYLGLARVKQYLGQYPEAEEAFKKAIQLDSENENIYLELGWYYRSHMNYFQAEEAFKHMVKLNKTGLSTAYLELASIYLILGRYSEAEGAFKEIIKIVPQNIEAHRGLLCLYEKMGNYKLSHEYIQKIKIIQWRYYDDITRQNFLHIKSILDRKGIKLACIQYPMRNIEPLKKVFSGAQDILFVDNEKTFKDALRKAQYSDYFTDIFAGDFGHCTLKGNRLLAENIADVILKEVSGR